MASLNYDKMNTVIEDSTTDEEEMVTSAPPAKFRAWRVANLAMALVGTVMIALVIGLAVRPYLKMSSTADVEGLAAEEPQPFYYMAHRVNSVGQIAPTLAKCFNAIEMDVRWTTEQIHVDHDGTYAWSTTWEEWAAKLESLDDRLLSRLALLVFDMKTSGRNLAGVLREHMRNSPKLKHLPIIFSVSDINMAKKAFTKEFIQSLRDNESIDVSFKEDPGDWSKWVQSMGGKCAWYADGINKIGIGHSSGVINAHLNEARRLKESDKSPIKGVYSWTWENSGSVKGQILRGVDGLVVNTGGRSGDHYKWAKEYCDILEDPEVKPVARLAHRSDFPCAA